MKVLKHGNRHPGWQSTQIYTLCFAKLEVSGSDVIYDAGNPNRFFFVCPECNRRNYKDVSEIPAELRSNARKDPDAIRWGYPCRFL